eukprot:403367446
MLQPQALEKLASNKLQFLKKRIESWSSPLREKSNTFTARHNSQIQNKISLVGHSPQLAKDLTLPKINIIPPSQNMGGDSSLSRNDYIGNKNGQVHTSMGLMGNIGINNYSRNSSHRRFKSQYDGKSQNLHNQSAIMQGINDSMIQVKGSNNTLNLGSPNKLERINTIPVMDVVKAYKRNKNVWGIDGYDFPTFNAHFDKVRTNKIVNNQKKNFIDDYVKSKSMVPAPAEYNTSGSLINPKKNSGLSKGKRITLIDEIIKDSEKNIKPGPGTYEDKTKIKYMGAFNLKDQKSLYFIDEANCKSFESPGYYDAKYDSVQEKTLATKIIAPKGKIGERFILNKNNSPSPVTYDTDKSYKETQLQKAKFFISKSKIIKYTDEAAKQKNYVPGVGLYNPDSALNKISKGLSQRKR